MATQEQVKRLATLLAAAYWRGRLETTFQDRLLEVVIVAAAESDWKRYETRAMLALEEGKE